MLKTNNARLQEIAEGMQSLNERLVYVGGAMAGSYANDPAATEPRPTTDVDCVVDSKNYAEHAAVEEQLRQLHFQNDTESDPPVICRWVYNGELVDIMSYEEKSLNFGNRWYRPGFEHREIYTLPSGKQIYRLPVAYYLATKIEALLSRGGVDWRGAKDFEDVIYVLNYSMDFMAHFRAAEMDVQRYLSEQFAAMLQRPYFNEEIECAISTDEVERTDMLIQIMSEIALYKPKQGLRIQFVSDLHLEFSENRRWLEEHPLEVAGDILLIAGDTAYLDVPESGRDTYSQYKFWDWASEHYKQVIVCFGNHDFYGYYDLATMPDGYCKQIRTNIHAYYNKVIHLTAEGGLTSNSDSGLIDIIVSTLWAKIEPHNAFMTEHNVSDFYRIKYKGHRLTADDFNSEHERCMAFIRQAVAESRAATKIVLTHHVPTQLCTAEEFRGSTINGAFTVELGDYIVGSGIDWWVYGHSHRNIDAQIGGTKIVSNQLGYISHGEHLTNGFNSAKYIETDLSDSKAQKNSDQ